MAKKKRKKISKQERNLKAKIYRVNKKNKEIKTEISELEKLDGRIIYVFETEQEKKIRLKKQKKFKIKIKPKRRRLKTIINIKKNEITKNNTSVERALNTLLNKFKYKPKNYGKKEFQNKKGVEVSVEYLAWQDGEAIEWITSICKKYNDKSLAGYILQIKEIHIKMDSKHVAKGIYTSGKGLDYFYYKAK